MAVMVRVEPAGTELEVAAGERLLDALDDSPKIGLPLRCRSANCATCLVRVERGSSQLSLPDTREAELLRVINAEPSLRLGCQVRIKDEADSGALVVVRTPRPTDQTSNR